MKKATFAEILKVPHTSVWVDNYNAPRSIRLVYDFEDRWPDAIIKAVEEDEAGINGEDPNTFISECDAHLIYVDVGKRFEKVFDLGWTGMSEG